MGALNWTCWQRAFIQCLCLTVCVFMVCSCADTGKTGRVENKNKLSVGKAGSKEKRKESCAAAVEVKEKERVEYDSITALHRQIDDDQSGAIDLSESDEFLREELQYTDGSRHTTFHGEDSHVTSDELWKVWRRSEVHNWTVDDALNWLVVHVELPQYVEAFKQNSVSGATLPRIAVNTNSYMTTVLGIRNPVHKQKLTLKAMDVVLFGPPKKPHSYIKDLILVMSLLIAMVGCWFAYIQHKNAQSHLKKMMSDLDTLQKAEDSLSTLQDQLSKAQEEHKSVREEKQTLEKKMKTEIEETKKEATRLKTQRLSTDGEIGRLKLAEEEIEHLRGLLIQAETQLDDNQFLPSSELQQWLQLTYEIELKHYEMKKVAAEKQLMNAKDGCEKLRKKRSTFMGSLRIAHSTGIDDIDQRILQARGALEEVRHDLQERLHRWRQIEILCGFMITSNPGLSILEPALHESYASPPAASMTGTSSQGSIRGSASNLLSVEDTDDEMVPPFKVTPSEPAKHGRFYTLGLAANFVTHKGFKNGGLRPCRSYTHLGRAGRVRHSGLHSTHISPSDLDRRTMKTAVSSDNVLDMISRSESEDHSAISPGSSPTTPEGPVRFSIDAHENARPTPERPTTLSYSKDFDARMGHSISVESALTKPKPADSPLTITKIDRTLGRPLSLQQSRSEAFIDENLGKRGNSLNGSIGALRKRGDSNDQPQSLTPPCTPLEENSSEEGNSLELSDDKKKEKKKKGFSVKFLKKDKSKKT